MNCKDKHFALFIKMIHIKHIMIWSLPLMLLAPIHIKTIQKATIPVTTAITFQLSSVQ